MYHPLYNQTIKSWSYGSWIYHYLCNQCLSPLTLWVRIPHRQGVSDTTLCDKVCQWLAAGRWLSPDTPVSFTNKIDQKVESDVKHHNPNPKLNKCVILLLLCFSQNLGSTYYIFSEKDNNILRQHFKSYRLYQLGFMR